MTYHYVAINSAGKTIDADVEAADRAGVLASIKSKGWRPVSVTESNKKSKGVTFFQSKKVKSDDLVMFTRQLSAMVSAGVPLLRAISSLEQNSDSKKLKSILGDVYKQIQSGETLANSLEKFPDSFDDVYVNMVRAGEAAGILDDILKRLALQQEKNAKIRKKVKSAMTYPTVLIVITILSFFGLMLFVIPQIGNIVKDLGGPDAELPALTQAMLTISHVIATYWYMVLPIIVGAVYGLLRYIKTPKGKRKFHIFILKVPGVKGIIQKLAIARFARTFSALMGAGVAVLESLRVTSRAIGNTLYEEAIVAAAKEVKSGKNLSTIIAKNDLFPAIVAQMLAVGEETGQTDTVLIKVAEFYEEEVDASIEGLSSIIEPMMIVVMGTMVGLIAASVMLPIANMSKVIK